MEFMKMVLHRGEAAIKVFLCALANTCGEDRAHSLLQQKDVCSESNGKSTHYGLIKMNVKNALCMFQICSGRFCSIMCTLFIVYLETTRSKVHVIVDYNAV